MACVREGNTIVCLRRTGSRVAGLCRDCGRRQASKLCDGPVVERRGTETLKGTCDKPLCEQCATSGGPNVDYCRAHAAPEDRRLAL